MGYFLSSYNFIWTLSFSGPFYFSFSYDIKVLYDNFRKNKIFGRNLGIFRVFYIVKYVSHECRGRATEAYFRGGIKEMKVAWNGFKHHLSLSPKLKLRFGSILRYLLPEIILEMDMAPFETTTGHGTLCNYQRLF